MNYVTSGLLLLVFSFNLKAAEMKELDISAGWDLSATLALFRNLPILVDSNAISETSGDVYFAREVKHAEADGQVFTNTYHFFRKTGEDKFLKITVVEEHRIADADLGEDAR